MTEGWELYENKIFCSLFKGIIDRSDYNAFIFCLWQQKYTVNFDGGFFESKRTQYYPGEKVTVRYDIIATDTDYHFYIDDDVEMKQNFDGGYVFTFIMPEHDVTLHEESYNSMVFSGN